MPSDPSDPLNQTGTGLPVFGKIKKLGESEKENVPADTFIPQAQYYDPEDFQDIQDEAEDDGKDTSNSVDTSGHYGFRLTQQPDPEVLAPDKKQRRLDLNNFSTDRLARHQALSEKEEPFSQQHNSEPKSEGRFLESFSPSGRKIIALVTLVCLTSGILISLNSLVLNLIFLLFSFPTLLVVSLQKRVLHKLGLFSARIVLALVFSLLFILIPLFYKSWQEQGSAYIQSFENVEKLINKKRQDIKKRELTAIDIDVEEAATSELNYGQDLATTFYQHTYLSGTDLFKMYLQYVLMLFALTLMPFVKKRNLLTVDDRRPENRQLSWRVTTYLTARTLKATIVTVIFVICLKGSNCENALFIAGTTFVFMALSTFGLIIGLVLCTPLIMAQFEAGEGMIVTLALLLTVLVALLIERRLHRLMFTSSVEDDTNEVSPSKLK